MLAQIAEISRVVALWGMLIAIYFLIRAVRALTKGMKIHSDRITILSGRMDDVQFQTQRLYQGKMTEWNRESRRDDNC